VSQQLDVKIDDENKAIILLCSLPSSYEPTVTIMMFGKGFIKIEDITAALLAQEQRRKNNSVKEPQDISLLVKGESAKEKMVLQWSKQRGEIGDSGDPPKISNSNHKSCLYTPQNPQNLAPNLFPISNHPRPTVNPRWFVTSGAGGKLRGSTTKREEI
jgi:hypothetical protein